MCLTARLRSRPGTIPLDGGTEATAFVSGEALVSVTGRGARRRVFFARAWGSGEMLHHVQNEICGVPSRGGALRAVGGTCLPLPRVFLPLLRIWTAIRRGAVDPIVAKRSAADRCGLLMDFSFPLRRFPHSACAGVRHFVLEWRC